jgi:nucleoid-associated protein YgaU
LLVIPVFSQSNDISNDILNNQYYRESIRFKNLAQAAFDEGDYDLSAEYAAESIRQAQLSDEYVALRAQNKQIPEGQSLLQAKANDAMEKARNRLDWATDAGIGVRHSDQYIIALGYWGDAIRNKWLEDWNGVIYDSEQVIAALAGLREADPITLPGEYTVQSWSTLRDCFWNIAGKPWVYNDPWQWQTLYNANKSKLPKPDDPNLLAPGTVLTIPSLHNEIRAGAWKEGVEYPTFK